jgi:hypothetical protein
MAFTISPNMQLVVPTVGSEPGPQYASDVNTSLALIDQHDHSPGRGVAITPSGININQNLNFHDFAAISLSYLSLVAGASATTTVQAISSAPTAGINELWYTDSNGTSTQITSNGVVNATAAAIPGESYNAGTFIWTQTQSSLPTTPANFDIGSIVLRPNTAGTTNGITLTPPSGISSAYQISLPNLPGSTSFMAISSSGVISTPVTSAGTNGQTMVTAGGVPTWSSLNNLNPMTAAGQMIYGGSGGTPAAVSAGTTGQALVSNGTSAPAFTGGIAAHAYSSSQINVGSPPGVLVFPATLINVGTAYNTSNGQFTCPVTGVYRVSIAGITNGSGGEFWYVYKNGSQYGTGLCQNPGANQYTGGTSLVSCSASDVLTIVGVTSGVPVASLYPSATFELVR